jgi:hypothetical protein
MDEKEQYEFDRQGFVIIKGLLSGEETARLARAIDELEEHALRHVALPPRKVSAWGPEYHVNEERGYHVQGAKGEGRTLIVEDFWNADPVFDLLADHPRTMQYIRAVVQGRITVNNSELRIRFTGNHSGTHMGGPIDHKYRYGHNAKGIDAMMVRMIYFVHEVKSEDGAFCVVPGTHKTNRPSPYGNDPHTEPGMIGLEVEAGDGILFTENLRHGGLVNRSARTRKTLHVGYGPFWMMSQNIATMDEPPYLTAATRARYRREQLDLFRAWPPKEK